jgi:hypothetical protein
MKKYPMPEDKKVDPTNVLVTCIFCNDRFGVEVNASDLKKWNMGELIQTAIPYQSADARELLISCICPKCF